MKSLLCKIQYVGKSKTPYNLKLNNHRKDINNQKVIPACHHFKTHGHTLKQTKFSLIEKLTEISNVSKNTLLRLQVKRREDFWINKLRTLARKGVMYKVQ